MIDRVGVDGRDRRWLLSLRILIGIWRTGGALGRVLLEDAIHRFEQRFRGAGTNEHGVRFESETFLPVGLLIGGPAQHNSANAIGFGSQGYVLSRVSSGSFRIKIHYLGAYAGEDARRRSTYNSLINRWDQLTADLSRARTTDEIRGINEERADVEARLDRWASPAASQTPVHAEVVLFPGTSSERR